MTGAAVEPIRDMTGGPLQTAENRVVGSIDYRPQQVAMVRSSPIEEFRKGLRRYFPEQHRIAKELEVRA